MASQPNDDRRPYSIPQLADRWGCSDGLIRKLLRNDRLHGFKLGALIRISAAEVERFECQAETIPAHGPSKGSGEGSPSSGGPSKPESGSGTDDNSPPKIGRAPRRRRAGYGKAPIVVHGPWGG